MKTWLTINIGSKVTHIISNDRVIDEWIYVKQLYKNKARQSEVDADARGRSRNTTADTNMPALGSTEGWRNPQQNNKNIYGKPATGVLWSHTLTF